MDDLISRQDAISAVVHELDMIDHVPQWVSDRLVKALRGVPSIDAVKHGRWKEVSDDMYAGGGAWICSSCHYGFSWEAYSLIPEEKYCPHCGARMDGEDDG